MAEIIALGAGRMGRGIAQVFAYAGHPVTLLDLKERPDEDRKVLFKSALDEVEENLAFLSSAGLFKPKSIQTVLSRIEVAGPENAETHLEKAEVVFEGVPEILEAKKQALEFVSTRVREDTIIASTTSTILVNSLAEFVSRPERFLNAHWLNPAYLIPLVEVSPGEKTEGAVTESLIQLLEAVGKVPVKCEAFPGFIVPRLQTVAMNEAARLVEDGVATAEDVDKAIRYGFGLRFASMGMLEFIDWGGGDILYYASKYLSEAMNSDRFCAAKIVEKNMEEGKIGLSTGEGFYDFKDLDISKYRRETLERFVDQVKHLGLLKPPA